MKLFNFGIATEANNYEAAETEEIWVKNEQGQLVLVEDGSNEND